MRCIPADQQLLALRVIVLCCKEPAIGMDGGWARGLDPACLLAADVADHPRATHCVGGAFRRPSILARPWDQQSEQGLLRAAGTSECGVGDLYPESSTASPDARCSKSASSGCSFYQLAALRFPNSTPRWLVHPGSCPLPPALPLLQWDLRRCRNCTVFVEKDGGTDKEVPRGLGSERLTLRLEGARESLPGGGKNGFVSVRFGDRLHRLFAPLKLV